jgi:pimeloyl-ACP methyl ester carboxylesterase
LLTGRIQAAIDLVRTFPQVDGNNIALVGYDLGGTGVLQYALTASAKTNNVRAIVSLSTSPFCAYKLISVVYVIVSGDEIALKICSATSAASDRFDF